MEISRRYSLYALGIIFFANFLNYLDRQLVSALEKPVTQALQLTGTEFGLLWTLFTIGYIVSAPVVGFLTDRYRRASIFAVCIFIWSLATISSGLADRKIILYISRFFIGVGEAGCLIIGPSLITEFFARKVRGRALSTFYLGLPLGGTAGYIVGGLFEKMGSWRGAFWLAGIPGLVMAVVIWLLKEPPRGAAEGQPQPEKMRGIRPYLELLKTRTLMYIIFAEAFAVMILVPILHFGKGYFQEARGFDPLQASLTLGVVALVGGVLGNLTSGFLGDRMSKKRPGAYALIAGCSYLMGIPFLLGSFFAGPSWLFVTMLLVGCFFYFMCMPAVNTQIANVTHPNQRAMAYALAVFALHFLGDMLTPPVFGKVSDVLTEKSDPVNVDRVRVSFPDGPARFKLQYKAYDRHSKDHDGENWIDLGTYATSDARAVVDFPSVRTTRIRCVSEAGPPPRTLEVFDGPTLHAVARTEVHDAKVSIIFGSPGAGRRFAFTLFATAMIVSGLVCFLAYRHAAADAARVAEALTKVRVRDDDVRMH